jgi:hypothetical protein
VNEGVVIGLARSRASTLLHLSLGGGVEAEIRVVEQRADNGRRVEICPDDRVRWRDTLVLWTPFENDPAGMPKKQGRCWDVRLPRVA